MVLNLGLDPTKFTQGQAAALEALRKLEEQSAKSGKEVESQSKKLLDFFVNLKREALGFLGAFYGGRGIKDVVDHLTHLDASAARLSSTINTAPETLAKWRIAMQEIGGSASDADAAIGGLSDAIQDFIRNPANPPLGLLTVAKQIGLPFEQIQDPIKFLEAMAKAAITQPQFQGPEGRARFAAMARDVPGMNQQMILLLLELEKRLSEAAKVTPEGGGLGPFSKEFIASIALFDAAVNNIARVILDAFVPAITSFTTLLTKWLVLPGSPEAKKIEQDFDKNLRQHFGTPPLWLQNLFGFTPEDYATGKGAAPSSPRRSDIGIGVFKDATGYSITTPEGAPIASGTFGARGAAAVSNANRTGRGSTNTSTTEVNVGTVNVNAPNVTNPNQASAAGIAGATKSSLGAPINSAY